MRSHHHWGRRGSFTLFGRFSSAGLFCASGNRGAPKFGSPTLAEDVSLVLFGWGEFGSEGGSWMMLGSGVETAPSIVYCSPGLGEMCEPSIEPTRRVVEDAVCLAPRLKPSPSW